MGANDTAWLCVSCDKPAGVCACVAPPCRFVTKLRPSPQRAMRALYDLEINCGLSSFWDEGWTVWIGDHMNGRHAEALFDAADDEKLGGWLAEAAQQVFPLVDFPWPQVRPYLFITAHLEAPRLVVVPLGPNAEEPA